MSGAYLSVSTGFPGSMHDAHILPLSNFYTLAEDKQILTTPCMDLNGTQIRLCLSTEVMAYAPLPRQRSLDPCPATL